MKKAIALFAALGLLLALCACGAPAPANPSQPDPTAAPSSPSAEPTEAPEASAEPTAEPTETPEPSAEPTEEPEQTPADEDAALIADIEAYFNQLGMNGLLATRFEDITELYLNEVLYQLHDEDVTYAEAVEAYTAAFGEPECDLSYMHDWSFDNFMWNTTGHGLREFADYDQLAYDPYSGLIFHQHGDVNYQPMKVLSVVHGDGGILYVYYCADWEWSSDWFYRTAEDGGFASEMLLTLTTETGLPCQFLPIRNIPAAVEG